MKKLNRIGENFITNEGYKIEIIECFGTNNCTVKFENGIKLINRRYEDIKRGEISNPNNRTINNIGYFGVGNYLSSINGVKQKHYSVWVDMIRRCYDEKMHIKNPTYKNCLVCNEWHNFQNFAKWFEDNFINDCQLDKDILIKGNKLYSPKTCLFVPHKINYLLLKYDAKRGEYPIGVNYHKRIKKFRSNVSINGKAKRLGYFDTPEEAFNIYKIAKEQEIKKLANIYKETITKECYEALINYQVEITD
jgi:hypothetical protein